MYCPFFVLFFAEKKTDVDKLTNNWIRRIFSAPKKKIAWWQVLTHTFFLSYQVVQGKLFVYPGWCSKFSEQREQSVVAYNGKL